MTEAELLELYTGPGTLTIDGGAGEWRFHVDCVAGDGALVRVGRDVDDTDDVAAALDALARDVRAALAAFPDRLAKLGKLAHART